MQTLLDNMSEFVRDGVKRRRAGWHEEKAQKGEETRGGRRGGQEDGKTKSGVLFTNREKTTKGIFPLLHNNLLQLGTLVCLAFGQAFWAALRLLVTGVRKEGGRPSTGLQAVQEIACFRPA